MDNKKVPNTQLPKPGPQTEQGHAALSRRF